MIFLVESLNKEDIDEDVDADDLKERIEREKEAAIKIQSNFKGYKTRKEIKEKRKMKEDEVIILLF